MIEAISWWIFQFNLYFGKTQSGDNMPTSCHEPEKNQMDARFIVNTEYLIENGILNWIHILSIIMTLIEEYECWHTYSMSKQ